MGLREQLADKFQEWACSQCDLPREEWLAMADECIRQMEWARVNPATHSPGCPQGCELDARGFSDKACHCRIGPLTAAPEGWKP